MLEKPDDRFGYSPLSASTMSSVSSVIFVAGVLGVALAVLVVPLDAAEPFGAVAVVLGRLATGFSFCSAIGFVKALLVGHRIAVLQALAHQS